MRLRVLRSLLGTVILASSLACCGCGGGIEPGIPESAKNMPPPEIPGEKEMNLQMKGAKR